MNALVFTLGVIALCHQGLADKDKSLSLKVLTVATEKTDGYLRFMRSADDLNISVEVVGMGEEWRGGDMALNPGGGHKINMLRPAVEKWKGNRDTLVMFTDSYDVLLSVGEKEIISKFLDFKADIVFSAEGFCWPDKTLANKYPKVALGKRFLCSGGFIGYAGVVHDVILDHEIKDTDDDQLYYTQLYLDEGKRSLFGMKLDHRSHIFQNLNGAQEEVELEYGDSGKGLGKNVVYGTYPAVFHGNGPSKTYLNYLSNYIGERWEGGVSQRTMEELQDVPQPLPSVLLAVFVPHPTPFLRQVLQRLAALNYPKSSISLYFWNAAPYHSALVEEWLEAVGKEYKSVVSVKPTEELSEAAARVQAIEHCRKTESDYYLSVDSVSMITDQDLIQKLLRFNKNVVAPLLHRPNKLWSNFWGSVASDGFYARSADYSDIVGRETKALLNVPHVMTLVGIKGEWLKSHTPSYDSESFDPELSFSYWMRKQGQFMFVSSLEEYGHLINPEDYSTKHLHNDMYQVVDNRKDWEAIYLHPSWAEALDNATTIEQPCPDVYWVPLMSEQFTRELVAEVEHFGQWSAGKHEDERLSGGYENVPTQDIHMTQVGFEESWLDILKSYVVPINEKLFPGYYSKGAAAMNFVVRYRPDGQFYLRPHHDASTYTINVAMSKPNVDHWGGGCRFLRYNCSVVDTRLGWALMHPGRMTHYHEGLPTTNGTRYIMVSFIDP